MRRFPFSRAFAVAGLVVVEACLTAPPALAGKTDPEVAASSVFLSLVVPPGAQIDHVFSRTISTTAPGYEETPGRISGSSDWVVVASSPTSAQFKGGYHYDGRAPVSQALELRDGGAVGCFDGACNALTDASGQAYNPRIWGHPPERLKVGDHWTVDLTAPWELGPIGRQEVTVRRIDAASGAITLERRGSGSGPWIDDPKAVKLRRNGVEEQIAFTAGAAKWWGYTTFRHGLVISDDLVSERELVLALPSGPAKGAQRQYILMNLAPPPG